MTTCLMYPWQEDINIQFANVSHILIKMTASVYISNLIEEKMKIYFSYITYFLYLPWGAIFY